MAKGARGEQTRLEILQTALRLFALNGYFATSMNDILEAVSLSKGAFYHHFKSKKDLALAVLEQLRGDYQQEFIEPVRAEEPGRRVGEMLRLIVERNQSGEWFGCLLLSRLVAEMTQQEAELAEQIVELVKGLIEFWREIISDDQTAGTIAEDIDPGVWAETIFTAMGGAIAARELAQEMIHLEQIAEQLNMLIQRKTP